MSFVTVCVGVCVCLWVWGVVVVCGGVWWCVVWWCVGVWVCWCGGSAFKDVSRDKLMLHPCK